MSVIFRYHNDDRLLPDYAEDMSATLVKRVRRPDRQNSKSGNRIWQFSINHPAKEGHWLTPILVAKHVWYFILCKFSVGLSNVTSTTMTTPATSTRPRWKAEGESDRTSSRGGGSAGHGPSFYFEARLVLDNVLPMQSGNYTCGPSNTKHASVRLHITKGQRKPNQSNRY